MTDTTTASRPEAGPNRTPRSEFKPTRHPGWKYEPAVAFDLSPSMHWSARDEDNHGEEYPHPNSRRALAEVFMPPFIEHLQGEDSEMEAEQAASGTDEDGGVMAVGFDSQVIEIGDLNKSNLARKMKKAWQDAAHGGTVVGPALKALIDRYDGEFEDDDPAVTRVHEITLVTDGEPEDPDAVLPYIKAANTKRIYNIVILGHGDAAKATHDLYQKAAADAQKADKFGKRHVNVYLFDGETDGAVIAEDMIAMAS
jgi:uncharacterized protein YegL